MLKKVLAVITAAIMIRGICAAAAAQNPPSVFAVSESADPGETIMIYGADFDYDCRVSFKNKETGSERYLAPEYLTSGCAAVTVPSEESAGIYEISVCGSGLKSEIKYVNLPEADYIVGDMGESISCLGSFAVIGKNLCLSAAPEIIMEKSGAAADVTVTEYDKYSIKATLSGAEAGEYTLKIKTGNADVLSVPKTVYVIDDEVLPKTSVSLKDYGADASGSRDSTAAFKNALSAASGGVLHIPRGRYKISETLEIPDNTEITGEAADLTSITWVPQTGSKPDILKGGAGLTVKNITVYVCGEYGNVISGTENTSVENVMIRAAAYYHHSKIGSTGGTYDGAAVSEKPYNMDAAVYITGDNFKMSGCDVYATNTCFVLKNVNYANVSDNKFRFGVRPFELDSCGKIIVEDNEFEGTSTYEQEAVLEKTDNVYISGNTFAAIYGGSRTAIRAAAPSGIQAGNVTAEGRKIIFPPAAETEALFAALSGGENMGAYITDGRGSGQWKKITEWDKTGVTVDSDWCVAPDESAVITFAAINENITVTGNTFTDAGTALKLESATKPVFAENALVRAAPVSCGGIYWYGTVADNDVEVGFVWGGTHGSVNIDTEEAYGGVLRGNTMQSNCFIGINGKNTQTLIEKNTVKKSENGFLINGLKNAVVKNNIFEEVSNVHTAVTAAETSVTYPHDGQRYIAPSECEIILYFDLPMNTDTFDNIEISDLSGAAKGYTIAERSAQMCRMVLNNDLNKNTVYKITLGGEIKDIFGNSFKEETISFITAARLVKCLNLSITDAEGNALEKLSGGQTASIGLDIKNCEETVVYTTAVLAVYDENGKLIKAYTKSAAPKGGETVRVNMEWCGVPENCGTVRLMVWADYIPVTEQKDFNAEN